MLSSKYFSLAICAPTIKSSILIPATAIGKSPTAVNTEYLPPILSGITKQAGVRLSVPATKRAMGHLT